MPFSLASVLSFDAQKKVPKKRAVLPATPTSYGNCAIFDRSEFVFRLLPSFFVLSNKALPPIVGTIPCARACLADGLCLSLGIFRREFGLGTVC